VMVVVTVLVIVLNIAHTILWTQLQTKVLCSIQTLIVVAKD